MNPPLQSNRISTVLGLLIASLLIACSDSASTNTTPQPTPSPQNKPVAEKSALAGLIKNVSLYPVPGRRGDLAISLIVSIHNSGRPDRVERWSLEVSSPSSGVPTGLEPVHVNGIVDLPGTNKRVDLAKEDLTVKSAEGVGSNSQVEGVLTFVLAGTEERALSHNSSSLILHFKDSRGNNYQTPKTYIGKKVGG
jgi:hypothetical protein